MASSRSLNTFLVVLGALLGACVIMTGAVTEIEFESEFFNDHREFQVKVPINLYGKSYTDIVVSCSS